MLHVAQRQVRRGLGVSHHHIVALVDQLGAALQAVERLEAEAAAGNRPRRCVPTFSASRRAARS